MGVRVWNITMDPDTRPSLYDQSPVRPAAQSLICTHPSWFAEFGGASFAHFSSARSQSALDRRKAAMASTSPANSATGAARTEPENLGPNVNISCWTLTAISAVFIALRMYCKFKTHRGIWWDDAILIISWVRSSCTLRVFPFPTTN